ncbi:MAG TPA: PepSY-associated TM helix domain-containing protein [Steroidobacteraceae bacterium]|jgi:uncharacterized iron-regulated membrane protein|nr:PepSY-associated TM helix domain-containing protein [Steroidobacteraceae bacterium]
MTTAGGYWRRPQAVRWRRALFQVHLWTGLALALYVVFISLTGSAIVFRREMDETFCPRIVLVSPNGPRLSTAQLTVAAQHAFSRVPRFDPALVQVRSPRVPNAAIEGWYRVGSRGRLQRLIDPYTGKDLGDAAPCEPAVVSLVADLHDELLGGDFGTALNGAGAVALTLMCLTGMLLWWPGASRWRRSLRVHRGVGWRRFTWDLHSMVGFWLSALLAMWAVSAIYLAFPNAFYDARDFLSEHGIGPATGHRLDVVIDWLVRLHFGRSFGTGVEVLWVIAGLAPCVLIVTGALMWWNRVIRQTMGRSGQTALEGAPPATELPNEASLREAS